MTIRALFAVVLVVPLAACGRLGAGSEVQGGFERTLSVTGPVTLDIRTGSGSIVVRSGPPDAVRVQAHISGRSGFSSRNVEERIRQIEASPPVEQTGGNIRIGHIADNDLQRNIRINYEVTAPVETVLQAQTGSGDQRIEDLRGPIAANTGSGSIIVTRIQADVRAATGSGDISGEGVGGSFDGRTGSGSIRVTGVGAAARARTGSGDVSLAQTAEGDVDVATGSGSIQISGARRGLDARTASGDVTIDGRPGGPWDIDTASGSVRLRVPPDSGFELNARTASGSVRVGGPLPFVASSSPQNSGPARRARGIVGNAGGPLVEISVLSGSIQIE